MSWRRESYGEVWRACSSERDDGLWLSASWRMKKRMAVKEGIAHRATTKKEESERERKRKGNRDGDGNNGPGRKRRECCGRLGLGRPNATIIRAQPRLSQAGPSSTTTLRRFNPIDSLHISRCISPLLSIYCPVHPVILGPSSALVMGHKHPYHVRDYLCDPSLEPN